MLSRNSSLSSTYSFSVFRTSSVATRSSRRDTHASATPATLADLESEIHSSTSLPYLSEDPPTDQPPNTAAPVTPPAPESVPPSRNPSLTAGSSSQQRSSLASANLTSPTSTSSIFSCTATSPFSSSVQLGVSSGCAQYLDHEDIEGECAQHHACSPAPPHLYHSLDTFPCPSS